jgi:putative transposase
VAEGIGRLVIGKNPLWKQQAHLGHRTNQHFVSVPHARCSAMLAYKAELVGIWVRLTEESYTSKVSVLDADLVPRFDPTQPASTFSGRRVQRGLYRAVSGCIGRRMGGGWAPDQRGCEWVVHHPAHRTP